jgi:hypothetical protein
MQISESSNILDGEFLSLNFYPTATGYAAGKKPGRNLAKIGFARITNNHRTADEYLSIWASTLKSYLPSSSHVPFLRVYLEECLRFCASLPLNTGIVLPKKYHHWEGTVQVPTDETFDAFEMRYGYDRSDEDLFRVRLRDHLRKYGLQSVFNDPIVHSLWAVDMDC